MTTVKELKDLLEYYGDDEEVKIEIQTNNYWNMVRACDIQDLQRDFVKYSTYLDGDKVIDNAGEEDVDDGDETRREVVLIQIKEN